MTGLRTFLPGLVGLTLLVTSCGHPTRPAEEQVYWVDDDTRDIPEPEFRDPDLVWTTIDRTTFDQGMETLDLDRTFRNLVGQSREAANINSFDEVPDCSWFTNRHAFSPMTPEEIRRGRAVTPGPDTTGPWLVFRPKVGGQTPGFWIEDARGDQYIIKFDPLGWPELSTAAAAMGTRFYYAAGYNVAQETIVNWRPEMLRIREGATIKNADGSKRPLVQADLDRILDQVEHNPDGTIRSLASLNLGKVKGPFSYRGRRDDDPNDWCDHEDRRELRGSYVLASLINHYDSKDQNSMDVYEESRGRHFLRHYMMDFGSTFGADGHGSKPPIKGYANFFDLRDVFISLTTLGLKTWPWEHIDTTIKFRSVGLYEAEVFHPAKFDNIFPNPAWENMTDRDAYWGAKIVMSFRDEHLRALVAAGQYSDTAAAEYVFETMKKRRDKIGHYWFAKVNPLDNFVVSHDGSKLHLGFDDLAIKYGLETAEVRYQFDLSYRGRRLIDDAIAPPFDLQLSAADLETMRNAYRGGDEAEDHLYQVDITTFRLPHRVSKPTRVWLWYDPDSNLFKLVGVEHLD